MTFDRLSNHDGRYDIYRYMIVNTKVMQRSLVHFLDGQLQVPEDVACDRFAVRTPGEARYVAAMHEWLFQGNGDLENPPLTADEALWKMKITVYSDGNGNECTVRAEDWIELAVMVQGHFAIIMDDFNLFRTALTPASFRNLSVDSMKRKGKGDGNLRFSNQFPSAPFDLYTELSVPVGVALPPILAVRYFASIAGSWNNRRGADKIRRYKRAVRAELAR